MEGRAQRPPCRERPPWRRALSQHRRLITPEFLALAHRSLIAGGLLVLQTDNRAYWQYIRRAVPLLFEFEELKGPGPMLRRAARGARSTPASTRLPIFRGQGPPPAGIDGRSG